MTDARRLGHQGRHDLVREHNRREILRSVYEQGLVSRAALAKATGLSKPTAGSIVEQLTGERVLRAETATIGGRERDVFGFADGIGLAMGVSLDASGIHASLTDIRGDRRARTGPVPAPRERIEIVAALRATIADCLAAGAAAPSDLATLTIAVPGAISPVDGSVRLSPTIPALQGIRLTPLLELDGVDVAVDNDANLAALGEGWLGAAAAERDYVALYVGQGVGMGIVSHGSLLSGAHGSAGEIGYLPIGVEPRDELAGGPGALEASIRAADRESTLVELVTQAVLTVAAVLDPAIIVLGGPRAGHDVAALVADAVRTRSPLGARIVPSSLGSDGVALGAAAHARRELLELVLGREGGK